MNKVPSAVELEILRLLDSGLSNRRIASSLGIALMTVCRVTSGKPRPPCPCGRAGGHKGWCPPRLAESKARRDFMATFVAGRKVWNDEADAVVRRDWVAGVDENEIARSANAILGRDDLTVGAIRSRASVLKVNRPSWYHGHLRRTGRAGRRKGTPNKATWARLLATLKRDPPLPAVPSSPVAPPVPPPAPRRGGFSMLAMQGPDPMRDVHMRQAIDARRGKV